MCQSNKPSLNISPIIFADIIENIMGTPREISPVASVTITVKLSVILNMPAKVEAAPINAYLPGSILCVGNKWAIPIPVRWPLVFNLI